MKHEGEAFGAEMIIRGCLERLSPVMMMAATSFIGLLPLLFGAGQTGKEILYPLLSFLALQRQRFWARLLLPLYFSNPADAFMSTRASRPFQITDRRENIIPAAAQRQCDGMAKHHLRHMAS